jgi:hypothetical protein
MKAVELGMPVEQGGEPVLDQPADVPLGASGPCRREDVEGKRDVAQGGEPNQQDPHAYQLVGSKRTAAA